MSDFYEFDPLCENSLLFGVCASPIGSEDSSTCDGLDAIVEIMYSCELAEQCGDATCSELDDYYGDFVVATIDHFNIDGCQVESPCSGNVLTSESSSNSRAGRFTGIGLGLVAIVAIGAAASCYLKKPKATEETQVASKA